MPEPITNKQIQDLAEANGIEYAALKAVIEVESSGFGFDPMTGKLIIQFERDWFKRQFSEWRKHQGTWINNGIGNQKTEWEAFNSAFAINKEAAMLSTSIGLPQIMGFHYQRLGYESVGEMWDFFKFSEYEQVRGLVQFIKTDKRLYKATVEKDWQTFAYIYNGAGYKAMAEKYKQVPYDIKLAKSYKKWKG